MQLISRIQTITEFIIIHKINASIDFCGNLPFVFKEFYVQQIDKFFHSEKFDTYIFDFYSIM
jgi:hypothetical protein